MPIPSPWSRRTFLRASAIAGGGLLVSWSGLGCRPGSGPPVGLGVFVRVDPDDSVTVLIPVPEIGQGVRTALAMLVAEELEVPWDHVQVEQAPIEGDLGPHPRAAGSRSVASYWQPLREAGAAARLLLAESAARQWGVPSSAVEVREGTLTHPPTRRRMRFGEAATDAAALPMPENVPLKPASAFRLIGTDPPGLDAPDIVRGRVAYGIDVRVPGMRVAVVRRSPTIGGSLRAVDDTAALAVPGVQRVVRIDPIGPADRPTVAAGVAVVADTTWAALAGRDALRVEWDEGPNAEESTDRLRQACEAALELPGREYRTVGNVAAAFARSTRRVVATYRTPFLAHATMEPPDGIAHVQPGRCEIWAPTQIPFPVREAVARLLELDPSHVTLHVTRMGGGFGRRLAADFILEAVALARQLDHPVQVVWTREDDLRHGFLRPFNVHRLEAGIDAEGRITVWRHHQAGTSRYAFRSSEHPGASEFREGTWPAALVPSARLEYTLVASNLPRGPIRSPGENSFVFPIECFLDEIALEAGRDPLALRLELLGDPRTLPHSEDDPFFDTARMRAVLEQAAERAGWGGPLPEGRGRGIASAFVFGTYLAHVAEVSVDPGSGAVRVHRVTTAVDCGQVVRPEGVRAQVEGGVIDGLSALFHGAITVEAGQVVEGNFDTYPLLRIGEAPEVTVHILPSAHPPTGAGEPPYPPILPAVANAIVAAGGPRIRDLPITPTKIRQALLTDPAGS